MSAMPNEKPQAAPCYDNRAWIRQLPSGNVQVVWMDEAEQRQERIVNPQSAVGLGLLRWLIARGYALVEWEAGR